MKLLFIAGSLRTDSYNKKIAKEAAQIALSTPGVEAKYIDLRDYEMPMYDADIESEKGLPETAKQLKQLFIESDGVFFASPEYNSSISAVLKNAIDWISRPHMENEESLVAFKGKAAMIVAASPGALGGIRGLVPLRLLLSNIYMNVAGQQFAFSNAHKLFDDLGRLTDEKAIENLKSAVETLIELANKK